MIKCSNSAKWEQLSFDEAVEPVPDGGKRVDQRDYRPSGALPVIDQGESFIGGYTDDLSKSYTGSLPVVVFGDHTRRVKLVNERFAVGAQGVKLLRPREGWDPKFFAYLFARLPIPNRGYSRHYQFVRKLTFRRPDLPEQQRIVAEIEKQFTRLDAGVASLKRVQTALKRYRASVLRAACEGRLVPIEAELARKENRSYESGEELLRRILKQRREKWNGKGKYKEPAAPNIVDLPTLPKGWTWATFEQIAQRVTVGHVGPMKHEYVRDGIPFLRSQNVRENRFDPEGLLFVRPEFDAKLAKSRVLPGDLAVVRSGSVGVTCVIPQTLGPANCADLVLIQRPLAFIPEFGGFYMNSLAKRRVHAGKVGVALTHFNTKSVATMPVPLPPMAEQRRIIDDVERRFSLIDELEAILSVNLQRGNSLKQSVLASAFQPSPRSNVTSYKTELTIHHETHS